jgi:hypothetical protein
MICDMRQCRPLKGRVPGAEEAFVAWSWELLGSQVLSARVVASTVSCQLWLVDGVQRRERVGCLGKVWLSTGEPYMC